MAIEQTVTNEQQKQREEMEQLLRKGKEIDNLPPEPSEGEPISNDSQTL